MPNSSKHHRRLALAGYAFVAPGMILLTLLWFVPVLGALYLSFTKYAIVTPPQWIGLANYKRLLSDELFLKAILNTAYYALGTIPVGMIIALILAVALNRNLRLVGFFRLSYYLPVITSMVAVSMIWLWIYNPEYGILNFLLGKIGISPKLWLAHPKWAMPSIIAMSIWKGVGKNMMLYLAGLQGIPDQLYDAAKVDGATGWKTFRHITWPLLLPTTFFILVVSTIGSFQVFEQVYIMTQGGPLNSTTTVVHQIYQSAFQFFKMGYASAQAFALFVLIFALSWVNNRFFGGTVDYS